MPMPVIFDLEQTGNASLNQDLESKSKTIQTQSLPCYLNISMFQSRLEEY